MRLPLNSTQLRIVLILMAFLTLSVGMMITSGRPQSTGNQTGNGTSGNTSGLPTPTPRGYVLSTADGTIVYGLWNSSLGSQIRIVNTDGTNDFPIALLPAKIKDVHILSNTTLLYINDTDAYDHGKTIELYKTDSRKTENLVSSNPGWGIDDMIVSPDRDYIAWWEVKFAERSKILLGGQSRVYLKNINTDETSLVTDEISSVDSPIHYPLLFDHNNRLFMDTFIPNQGRAFYLGVEYVTPDNPKDLHAVTELSLGKFSSEVEISPTDNLAVYTGFDYTARPIIENPFYEKVKRSELDNPNQIVLLNLDTFTPTIIADSKEGKQYGNLIFSSDGKYALYTLEHLSVTEGKPKLTVDYKIGIYSTDDNSTSYIDYPERRALKIIDYVNGKLVYGEKENGQPAFLGEKYASSVRKFSTQSLENNKISLSAQSQKMQFLTYLPRKTQGGKLITLDSAIEPTITQNPSAKFGQLLIPEEQIFNNRLDSQNNPDTLANQTQNPDSPTPLPSVPTEDPCAGAGWCGTCCELVALLCGDPYCWADAQGKRCDAYENHDSYYKCYDSPLYLYPEKTTQVQVKPKVGKRIYYSNPKLIEDSWLVTADPKGNITTIEGENHEKIDYFYFSVEVPAPERGVVVSVDELPSILRQYGKLVGLNERETSDFVAFWIKELGRLSKPYFFISHYDPQTAAKIMSFDITPAPDTFMQVIMYFKALNRPINVSPPDFEDIPQRKGFTVVDWSGKIEP